MDTQFDEKTDVKQSLYELFERIVKDTQSHFPNDTLVIEDCHNDPYDMGRPTYLIVLVPNPPVRKSLWAVLPFLRIAPPKQQVLLAIEHDEFDIKGKKYRRCNWRFITFDKLIEQHLDEYATTSGVSFFYQSLPDA